MGRELQKKKRRSGRPPVRQSNRTKKILNPRGNSVIAKNWYAALALTVLEIEDNTTADLN